MLNKKTRNSILILALAFAIGFSGCSADALNASGSASADTAINTTAVSSLEPVSAESEDSDSTYDIATATTITLIDGEITISGSGADFKGNVVTISKAGTYVIQGTLEAGQLIVEADQEEKVHVILNGAAITSSSGPAIWIKSAEKVILTLAEGTENRIQDSADYVLEEGADEPDAALFSKEDLSINGSGKLTVTGNYANGIKSKDTLLAMGGTLEVSAVAHALSGKDAVGVFGGTLTLTAGEDGIHSSSQVLVEAGSVTIAATDDGIHGDASLTIDGGTIHISRSNEGLESAAITVNGGDISLTAKDDGINASGGKDSSEPAGQPAEEGNSTDSDYFIRINGGTIRVNAEGDGIDANGSLYFTGGTVLVSGPVNNGNGALDYDGTCEITGGILAIAGSSGMAQAPGTSSTQNSVLIQYTDAQPASTLASLVDADGKAVVSFAPAKTYQSIVISSPELVTGESFTLVSGGTSSVVLNDGYAVGGVVSGGNELTRITLSKVTTSVSDSGTEVTGGMGGGPRPGKDGGGMKPPQGVTMPPATGAEVTE